MLDAPVSEVKAEPPVDCDLTLAACETDGFQGCVLTKQNAEAGFERRLLLFEKLRREPQGGAGIPDEGVCRPFAIRQSMQSHEERSEFLRPVPDKRRQVLAVFKGGKNPVAQALPRFRPTRVPSSSRLVNERYRLALQVSGGLFINEREQPRLRSGRKRNRFEDMLAILVVPEEQIPFFSQRLDFGSRLIPFCCGLEPRIIKQIFPFS